MSLGTLLLFCFYVKFFLRLYCIFFLLLFKLNNVHSSGNNCNHNWIMIGYNKLPRCKQWSALFCNKNNETQQRWRRNVDDELMKKMKKTKSNNQIPATSMSSSAVANSYHQSDTPYFQAFPSIADPEKPSYFINN